MPINKKELVEPIEDAKGAILNMAVYYNKALIDAGYSKDTAKQIVAERLEQVYHQFCDMAEIQGKTLGGITKKVSTMKNMMQGLSNSNDPEIRNLYNQLISLESQLKKE